MTPNCLPLAAALLGIFAFPTAQLAAEPPAPRPMTLVDLIELPSLSNPEMAPDGEEVVFTLAEADWEKNKRTSHLWRADVKSGVSEQLTFGDEGQSSPRWSPDGRWIAFLAQRGDDEVSQIYLLPRRGGEARRLTEHETPVSDISWANDGQSLFFVASDPQSKEEKEKKEIKDDVFAYDEDYQQEHLWRVFLPGDRKEKAREERVTEGAYSILAYQLARDGERLIVARSKSPLIDDSDESELWILQADGSSPRQLTDNRIFESRGSLSPDGTQVLFLAGANQEFEGYHNTNLFVMPSAGGKPSLLLAEMPHEVNNASWSADGKAIYFTANTGVRRQLFRHELGGKAFQQLTEGDHSFRSWVYSDVQDKHLVAIESPANAGDLWLFPGTIGSHDPGRQISHFYDELAQEFQLPKVEAVHWSGADGQKIEGLLYYPLDYQDGQRYPLAVQTHGGPTASDKFSFPRWGSYIQVLAARGWMVFRPNYRGSTGYGDEFMRDMVGHYFNQAHLDVMTGVDALIERGLVDGDRMIKMGWSAGGHMTNKIITFTDRFKAASSGAGAVNWISMYGQSDVRIYRTPWFGGTPWEKDAPIDVYWQNSPLKDIWRVTTPTLVLVGENDVRVPMPQSVELYRAMKTNGVETKLYVAPREPHGWGELRHELFKGNVELDWFERWALGSEYTWEEAPKDPSEEESESPDETEES